MHNKELFRAILLDQQTEKQQFLVRKIPRDFRGLESRPRPDARWATVISGVRRCGKSVFAHQISSTQPYFYVNFDDERLIETGAEDFDFLLQVAQEQNPGVRTLLLDEVQNIQGWELFVNRILRKGYTPVITGSNAHLLSKELATHLTGRVLGFTLMPFSFQEFIVAKGLKLDPGSCLIPEERARWNNAFNEYMSTGGFPDMVMGSYSGTYLRQLYEFILLKDVVSRYRVRAPIALKEVAFLLMNLSGQRFTFQKLSRLTGIKSINTIKRFADALESVYLISQRLPYSGKAKDLIRQPRKCYPIDLGLLEALTAKTTPDHGLRLECLVDIELRRRGLSAFSFQDKQSREADFVIRTGRSIEQVIQVAHSLQDPSVRAREIAGLESAAKELKCRELLILTQDTFEEIPGSFGTIRVMPVWKWLVG